MAKFFVGQRVRLVGTTNPKNFGREGIVSSIGSWGYGDLLPCGYRYDSKEKSDLYVDWDGFIESGDNRYYRGPIQSYRVEPILPEGASPSIYSYQELMDKLREGERV